MEEGQQASKGQAKKRQPSTLCQRDDQSVISLTAMLRAYFTVDSSRETVTSLRPSGEYDTAEALFLCDSRMYRRVAVFKSYTMQAPLLIVCQPARSRRVTEGKRTLAFPRPNAAFCGETRLKGRYLRVRCIDVSKQDRFALR